MNDETEAKLRAALTERADAVRVGDPTDRVTHRIAARRHQRRRRLLGGSAVIVAVAAALALVPLITTSQDGRGASDEATTAEPRPGRQPAVISSHLVRDTHPSVPFAAVQAVEDANTKTAIDLYHQLAATPGNVFFSPYSIETALSMAAAGARGQTLAQMLAVLHDTANAATLHDATNALNLELLGTRTLPSGQGGNPLELELANSVWSQTGFAIRSAFLDLLARDYGAELNTVDFEHAAATATARINAWVDAHTNHMIPKLLTELDEATRLVLVNAVHFKASWARPFESGQTTPAPFTTTPGTHVTVPFMHRDSSSMTAYASGSGWQAVDLPYIGDASMTVIVPAAGHLDGFERSLDARRLDQIVGSFAPALVDLRFPKLKLDDTSSLGPMLERLGMKDAFGNADFSGIDGQHDLEISQVQHEAAITVDEEGTEAAAATAVGIHATSGIVGRVIDLTVDHPYLFLIRDTKTGTILFMGRVTDPTQTTVRQP
jgi:serpin B